MTEPENASIRRSKVGEQRMPSTLSAAGPCVSRNGWRTGGIKPVSSRPARYPQPEKLKNRGVHI